VVAAAATIKQQYDTMKNPENERVIADQLNQFEDGLARRNWIKIAMCLKALLRWDEVKEAETLFNERLNDDERSRVAEWLSKSARVQLGYDDGYDEVRGQLWATN